MTAGDAGIAPVVVSAPGHPVETPTRPRLDVAVLTFRRPEALRALLGVLPRELADVTDLCEPGIIVVDNDPDAGAREIVPPGVRYRHEPEPGIAAARNRALTEAAQADVLVFIDDDETPRAGWLRALVETWVRERGSGVAAVAGPVLPRYVTPPAAWIEAGPFHSAPDFVDGQEMTHAASGNLLLDLAEVRRRGVRFASLGTRGGEDTHFTAELRRRGGRIVWCSDAIADEDVPAARTSARWVCLRSLADGNVWGATLLRENASVPARLRLAARGTLRIAGGGLRSARGWAGHDPAAVGSGIHTVCRGVGFVLAGADIAYDEYARDGRRWKRA